MSDTVTTEQVAEWVEALASSRRRARQEAAHELALAARQDASLVDPHVDALIDALFRPEAQTRWEVLDALSATLPEGVERLSEAAPAAADSLFDEASAIVRLASFRFLARYGQTSPARSDEVWPLLDEAVQCFHGDAEYRDMLGALLDFVRGDISGETRAALERRI